MKCKYCENEVKYDEQCDTHFMLGAFFQYELLGQKWNRDDDSNTFTEKYELWLQEVSEKAIENIRKNYWLN